MTPGRLQNVLMSFSTAKTGLAWPSQFCSRDGPPGPSQGYLSDNPDVEAVIQGILTYGPAAVLLLGAPIRIAQLYGAKLVVLPNRRGYVKVVGDGPVPITKPQ